MNILLGTQKQFSKETELTIDKILKNSGHELIIPENSLKELLVKKFPKINGLIVRSDIVDGETLKMFPNLQIIVRAGSGYDNIDVSECTKRDIVVETTPGANANAVAELTIALLFQHSRNYLNGTVGYELSGKTLGIHGYGNIGKLLAKKAVALGMIVYVYDPMVFTNEMLTSGFYVVHNRKDLYEKCQHISINIPLNDSTKKTIGKYLMSSMPPNAVLINTSRGGIINDQELKDVLGVIRPNDFSYISDVELPCRDWLERIYPKPKVFFTPVKQGAQTAEANMNAGIAAANQIVEFFKTGVAKFRIN